MSSEPQVQVANLTMDALIKEHNALVHVLTDNIQLKEYIRRLEAVVEAQNGVKETEPVREVREEVQVPE